MDFTTKQKIYMIGIKGVGMTMLAEFLVSKGHQISGSDTDEIFMTDTVLKNAGIKVIEGFNPKNIPKGIDLIIYSTAYNKNTNVELAYALDQKTPIVTFAEALGKVFNQQYGVAVAGSHGKTTTTAWLGYILKSTGRDPNVMVGARVEQFGGAGLIGKSDILVVEADEYQNKLSFFMPQAAVLLNIDYDHPDFFPTNEDYNQAFIDFILKIPKKGWLVVNFDDPVIRSVAEVNCRGKIISYAIDEAADFVAHDIKQAQERQIFKVKLGVDVNGQETDSFNTQDLGEFSIRLLGKHNVSNALAVIASAVELGIELHEIRHYLEEFTGAARRLETMGTYRGAIIIDDYAHHPAEIKATLEGARQKYTNDKLIVVFHPHTFTRTKALINDFANCFSQADQIIILDIYGSAREEPGGVHSQDLVKKIKEQDKNAKVEHIPTLLECEKYLRKNIGSGDLVLLMGAGDVFRIGENLVK